MDNQIHHFDYIDAEIYLTEEDHNMFAQDDENTISEVDSEQYLRGHHNSIDYVQRKLKLRSWDLIINKGNTNPNQLSSSQQNLGKHKYITVQKNSENKEKKSKEIKQPMPIDVDRPNSSFNMQS